MIRVGITGNIGSGKSTVCQIFETLGIPIYYADKEAKKLYTQYPEIKTNIQLLLGTSAYDLNGQPNFTYIKDAVFKDAQTLQEINAILHPYVFKAFDDWCTQQAEISPLPPYILKEAAILFESGADKTVDKSILVTAPEALKIARASQRDGVLEEEISLRLKKQFPESVLIPLADFVINNDGHKALIPQVLKIHREICLS